MPPSIACAKAGVTTGEWGEVLRQGFGEYRAPTGVSHAARNDCQGIDDLRAEVDRVTKQARPPAKNSSSASPASTAIPTAPSRSRSAHAMPAWTWSMTASALLRRRSSTPRARRDVHVVGLSILSGSHMPLVKDVVTRLREAGLDDVPVVVGGIIPPDDAASLKETGVAAVYTPKDFELNRMMTDVLRIVERSKGA